MKKIIWLSVFCVAFSINAFSQGQEISRDDYLTAYREAWQKFRNLAARRETSKEEIFKADGSVERTVETVTENLKPNRWRFLVIEKSEKFSRKSDLLKIGENYYCQLNGGDWEKSLGGCNQGWAVGFTNIVSQQFFVETVRENEKSLNLYRQYVIHKIKDNVGAEVLWYYDLKLWITQDGNFLRQEIESGLKESNEIRSKSVTIYEYTPKNLKIEVPTKP